MKKGSLKRHTALKPVGKRGKRLAAGDKKVTQSAKARTCEHCPSLLPADPHHIVGRRVESLRHDPENLLYVCRDCHDWVHRHPDEFRIWLEMTFPGRLDRLQAKLRGEAA